MNRPETMLKLQKSLLEVKKNNSHDEFEKLRSILNEFKVQYLEKEIKPPFKEEFFYKNNLSGYLKDAQKTD